MKRLFITLLILGTMIHESIGQTGMLITTDWLKTRMEQKNLVIFHVGREADYQKEHIEGAILLDPETYTYEDDTHIFDLPTDAALNELFETKGLTNKDEVVIYTSANWIPLVTRLYFTLDYLGHGDKTFILNGGLLEWKAEGEQVVTEIPTLKRSTFTIKPNRSLLADTEYVSKHLKNSNTTIVDCRAAAYYTGIDINEHHSGGRKGHIAGASNIPYTSLYEKAESGAIKIMDANKIKEIFAAQGVENNKDLILYCHIGMQMTVVYTAAKILGYKNVSVYDGSFHEWGPTNLPVELE